MKVCIPVASNQDRQSVINAHFGSSPCFLVYSTETDSLEEIPNSGSDHQHGACNPVAALAGRNIEAVVCAGIGRNAILRLNEAGIRVFVTNSQTAGDVISELAAGQLKEITLDQACQGHHNCR